MRVGKVVVDAIETRGGDNTSYTSGQASNIMCMYRAMELTFWPSWPNMPSCFCFIFLLSALGFALVENG